MRKGGVSPVIDRDFGLFFEQYYKPLCAVAFTYLRDEKDAEDIVQQIFVRLWERRQSCKVEKSLKSYLFAAVRNTCLNHLQRRQKRLLPLSDDFEETARQAMEVMLDEERQRIFMLALNGLTDRNRRIFELVYFEGKTYLETAELMQISINTVKWHLKTALSSLRSHPAIEDYFRKK